MLNRLAFSGFKDRWKDYLVLFSGLTISAAIFYMFQTLAMNKSFLKSNSPVGITSIVFEFGTVLLVIITLVYILYANNFLMSMRSKEYGMFMMLGAKTKTVARLIMTETLGIGLISSVVGIILGMGLTRITAGFLAQQMDFSLSKLHVFYWPAILATLVVFGIVFIFSSIKNSITIARKPVLTLLKSNQEPTRTKQRFGVRKVFELILGVALLAIGYYAMANAAHLTVYTALPVAIITIILGTYYVISTLFSLVINFLRRNDFALKKLHSFTLEQLNFRITDYTKILSMVSILFALSLGALTVGVGFRNSIQTLTNNQTVYDVTVNDVNSRQQKMISQLSVKKNHQYTYKIAGNKLYLDQSQLNQDPWKIVPPVKNTGSKNKKTKTKIISAAQINDPKNYENADFKYQLVPEAINKDLKVVSDNQFQQIHGQKHQLNLLEVNDFYGHTKQINKIESMQKNYAAMKQYSSAKILGYNMINEFFSGLEFMGFFLGLAFLAMLASCLMFKILSGASSDIQRYKMLNKIGARRSLMSHSINQELGTLFVIPGVMGIVHVLFGLQMFKDLIANPYDGIWLPILIFVAIYGLYYLVTIWLYKLIVLRK